MREVLLGALGGGSGSRVRPTASPALSDSPSSDGLLAAFLFNASIFMIVYIAFSILRLRLRSFFPSRSANLPPLPTAWSRPGAWLPALLRIPDDVFCHAVGLDGTMAVRMVRPGRGWVRSWLGHG